MVILSFRPLTGIQVLNSPLYKWLNYGIENRICGADFIFRLLSDFPLKFAFKNPQRPPFHPIGAEWYKIHKSIHIIPYFEVLCRILKYFSTTPPRNTLSLKALSEKRSSRHLSTQKRDLPIKRQVSCIPHHPYLGTAIWYCSFIAGSGWILILMFREMRPCL